MTRTTKTASHDHAITKTRRPMTHSTEDVVTLPPRYHILSVTGNGKVSTTSGYKATAGKPVTAGCPITDGIFGGATSTLPRLPYLSFRYKDACHLSDILGGPFLRRVFESSLSHRLDRRLVLLSMRHPPTNNSSRQSAVKPITHAPAARLLSAVSRLLSPVF